MSAGAVLGERHAVDDTRRRARRQRVGEAGGQGDLLHGRGVS